MNQRVLLILLSAGILFAAGTSVRLVRAGDAEVPRIGRHADPREFVFEGAQTFSPEKLVVALGTDFEFLLAAYPDRPLSSLLPTIERQLTLGYQSRGFPNAQVTASYDRAADRVRVVVTEGPRYRKGDIRVVAPAGVSDAEIIAALTKSDDEKSSPTEVSPPAPANQQSPPDQCGPRLLLVERLERGDQGHVEVAYGRRRAEAAAVRVVR